MCGIMGINEFEFGGIVMSKMSLTEKKVIALAYFHRYGWIATMMACMAIWPEQLLCILCAGCIVFSPRNDTSFCSLVSRKEK